jgi:replicative DNA helicase
MTAALRHTLHLVPSTPGAGGTLVDSQQEADDYLAESVVRQWQPEHQFIGALLYLTVDEARPLLDLVPDTAITKPVARWAYELIRRLVDAGDKADPVSVLTAGKCHAARNALRPAEPPTDKRQRELALYLVDAYTQNISSALAGSLARQVLDDAYQRAFGNLGLRMQQLSEADVDRAELTEQFGLIREELAELWRRGEAAAKLAAGGAR